MVRFLTPLLLASAASAQVCPHIEYAELQTYSKEELIAKSCAYGAGLVEGIQTARRNQQQQCMNEDDRIRRELKRRFGIDTDAMKGACKNK
jgi:hypothetical protein